MPYETTSDLPSQTDSLGKKQKRAFKQAFNSAVYDQGKDEKTAFKIAWSAAKKVGESEETSKHASLQKHLLGQHDQDTHGRREHKELKQNLRNEERKVWQRRDEVKMDTVRQVVAEIESAAGLPISMIDPNQVSQIIRGRQKTEQKKDPQLQDLFRRKREAKEEYNPRIRQRREKKEQKEETSKHLIGRHEQKDHDPTKHSRSEHSGLLRGEGKESKRKRWEQLPDEEKMKALGLETKEQLENTQNPRGTTSKHLMSKAYSVAKEKGYDEKQSAALALFVAKQANSGEGELAKHLKGKHDQMDHGSPAREKWSSVGPPVIDMATQVPLPYFGSFIAAGIGAIPETRRRLTKEKRDEITNKIQGSSVSESMKNASDWFMEKFDQGDQIEHAAVIDDDGSVLEVVMGSAHAAEVPGQKQPTGWLSKLKGKNLEGTHVTHLHPYGSSEKEGSIAPLSPMDFALGARKKAKSVTAVTKDGESRVKFDFPTTGKAKRKFSRDMAKGVRDYNLDINDSYLKHITGKASSRKNPADQLVRTIKGQIKFKRMSGKEKSRVTRKVSQDTDASAHRIFNDIDGVTYESDFDFDKE